MTRLSMIVPLYQLGEYLAPMLQTVGQQTSDCELWLVDDGSTDRSLQVATQFVAGIPHWHVLALGQHRGISAARNAGLAQATGDVVAFVDGDDRLAPDFVATLTAGFEPGVVATAVGYHWWYERAPRQRGWQELDQAQMFAQVTQHGSTVGGYVWNKAFSRAAIGRLRFDESLQLAEDYWFTASFVAANPGRYRFAPAIRYQKTARANSTIRTVGWRGRQQEAAVFARIARLNEQLQASDDDHGDHQRWQ